MLVVLVNELRRDGLETDRHNLLNPTDRRSAYITKKLAHTKGPVIAVSDFMRAKITTARFYADHMLTKAPGIRDSIVEGAESVTALAVDAF